MSGFSNKVAVVVGSSSGIGAATAIELAKEGADVVLIGLDQEGLDQVAATCEKNGKKPLIFMADITKEGQAKRIINETVIKFDKIDILVNSAGIGRGASIESDNIMQAYDEVMAVNVRGMVHITHLAVPHLIKTEGNIVNVSSIATMMVYPSAGLLPYSMSKAAIDNFTRSIAFDLSRYNVRVNAVNPGPVNTNILRYGLWNMSSEKLDEAEFDGIKEETALQRISEPKEIADLIVFLASDKAKGITGSTNAIDNGMMIYHKNIFQVQPTN